ncbi:MAG: hypothetical protein IPJ28_00475 [Betaproteobacteria bacterium]|nr:hypothetical protein [Betaproteobacteria bacterium]
MRELARAQRIDEKDDHVLVGEDVVAPGEGRADPRRIRVVRADGGVERLPVVRESRLGSHARRHLVARRDLEEFRVGLRPGPGVLGEAAVERDLLPGRQAKDLDGGGRTTGERQHQQARDARLPDFRHFFHGLESVRAG